MGLRILNGEPAVAIPVKTDLQGRYVFDYRQLQRYGLEHAPLPAGSAVINRPSSSIEIDRNLVIFGGFVTATLAITVVFLVIHIRMRRRSEPADLLGRSFADLIDPTDHERCAEALSTVVSGGSVEGLELSFRRKDGGIVYLEINAAPVSADGAVIGVQGAGREITERKLMEVMRSEAFAQIDQNIEQFATLGDEIRNPLAVIVGIADLYCEEKYTERILEQAEIIDGIITRLDRGWIESEKVREFLRKH
jgi:signal transduction histidine kinase